MAQQKIGGVTRRNFVKGGLAASALAALAACKNDAATGGEGSEGGASGAILNYYINNPVSIDPYNAQEDQGLQVCYQLFDALTIYDFDTDELMGLAAESWDVNDAADEFTFHLVEGATFHNGDPVTAADFKYAWERVCNPKTGNQPSKISYHLSLVDGYDAMLDGSATELSGLSCPDDNTFVVKLSAPYADFPFVCSHPALSPVPSSAPMEAGDDFDAFFRAPIGNGAFKMDGSWVDGQEINLVRYDDYYGEAAKIDGVHFSIQKDVETAYREFQAGNLDVCQIPTAQLQDAIDQYGESEDGYNMAPEQHVLDGAELSTYYILINMEDEQMADVNLRHALSLAINREAICETCFMGIGATPADNIVPPGLDGYEEGAWPYAKYDPEQAAQILDEAGYTADADGNRGITLTLSYNLDGSHKQIMEMVIADFNALGIQVESDTQEWATILDNYAAGNFQFGRLGWIADYPIMDNFIYPLFYTGNGDNRGKYSNAEVDSAIDAARATLDKDARTEALKAVNRVIAEDCPDIPIFFYTHTMVGSERVNALNMNMLKLVDMAEVELEA